MIAVTLGLLFCAACGNVGEERFEDVDSAGLQSGGYTDSNTSSIAGDRGNPDSSTQGNPVTDDRIERGAVGNDTDRNNAPNRVIR